MGLRESPAHWVGLLDGRAAEDICPLWTDALGHVLAKVNDEVVVDRAEDGPCVILSGVVHLGRLISEVVGIEAAAVLTQV